MKKLLIFCIFFTGFLQATLGTEQSIVKIGDKLTIYTAKDYGESGYWGRNVVIDKTEITLPADAYFEGLGIPKEEWEMFSQNKNGIFDTRLEKIVKEKNLIKNEYNLLFAENTDDDKRFLILEIISAIIFLSLIFSIIKIINLKSKIIKCVNLKEKINKEV